MPQPNRRGEPRKAHSFNWEPFYQENAESRRKTGIDSGGDFRPSTPAVFDQQLRCLPSLGFSCWFESSRFHWPNGCLKSNVCCNGMQRDGECFSKPFGLNTTLEGKLMDERLDLFGHVRLPMAMPDVPVDGGSYDHAAGWWLLSFLIAFTLGGIYGYFQRDAS